MAEVKNAGIGEGGKPLKQMLEDSDRLTEETGCYAGVTELNLKEQDPIKFELFHSRLLSSVIAGRETTRMVAASPVAREAAELCTALYSPEGHSIVNSTGIQIHIEPMGNAIQWMVRNDYEGDPGINEGDLFTFNDAMIAGFHPADVYDIVPIFWQGELVAWAVTVIMEVEVGGVCGSAMPSIFNVQRPTDGLVMTGEKTGIKDRLRRDFVIRIERNLRQPHYFILDRKGALAADISVREEMKRLIGEVGLDYFRRASRELIEDSRRAQLHRMRERTVPGRFQIPQWLELPFKDLPVPAFARRDVIRLVPADVEIKPSGKMTIDFDGAGDWGWHSLNCTPQLVSGVMGHALNMTMAYDGRASHGTLMTLDLNCPYGTIMNPPTHFVPTSNQFAAPITFAGDFLDALSRAYFARGFREEILLGMTSVNILGDSMLAAGDPRIPAMGEFNSVCPIHFTGGLGSGGRGIADGIDLHMFNPEGDSGSVETFEPGMAQLCLGARIIPDSGGFGKYRGGFSLVSTNMIHRVRWTVLETWGAHATRSILQNRGIFGGYPGNLYYGYVVRNANTRELIEQRLPLPVTEGDPRNPDIKRLVSGETTLAKHWWYTEKVLGDYDLFQVCMNSNNGGYGDPIQRDTELIKPDLDVGFTTEEACKNIYCVDTHYDEKKKEWTIDEQKTQELRATRRRERLQRGVPFKEWWQKKRERIVRGELHPLLMEMFHSSMEKSPKFAEGFRQFWSLPPDFTFGGE